MSPSRSFQSTLTMHSTEMSVQVKKKKKTKEGYSLCLFLSLPPQIGRSCTSRHSAHPLGCFLAVKIFSALSVIEIDGLSYHCCMLWHSNCSLFVLLVLHLAYSYCCSKTDGISDATLLLSVSFSFCRLCKIKMQKERKGNLEPWFLTFWFSYVL